MGLEKRRSEGNDEKRANLVVDAPKQASFLAFAFTLFVCFRGVVLDFWGYSICFLHTQMSSMEEQ